MYLDPGIKHAKLASSWVTRIIGVLHVHPFGNPTCCSEGQELESQVPFEPSAQGDLLSYA